MTFSPDRKLSNWGWPDELDLVARYGALSDVLALPDPACWEGYRLTSLDSPPFTLRLADEQLTLTAENEPQWAGIAVDFLAGSMAHRRRQPVGGEMVVKAVWGRGKEPITVLDATAGLGRDGFLLASSGATVVSCERHPAIALLLADGYWRARQAPLQDPEGDGMSALAALLSRWTLRHGDAGTLMRQLTPDVIYLDPMFPEREKSALVKKEMRAFRELVGEDLDAQALFDAACQCARKRVVVKRPSSGVSLGRKPSHVLEGKSNRFDVYTVG
jgi:16S rRNA (guanine1516-N2)-methyltransferase